MTSKQLTENSLGIFWNGEEVTGITAYGYWRDAPAKIPAFPQELWPTGTAHKRNALAGDHWHVCVWDIRIRQWPAPEQWFGSIRATLQSMIDSGADAAWCGLEGFFVDPPDLFKPEMMSGGVWAALTRKGMYCCAADLGHTFRPVSDDVLTELRRTLSLDDEMQQG